MDWLLNISFPVFTSGVGQIVVSITCSQLHGSIRKVYIAALLSSRKVKELTIYCEFYEPSNRNPINLLAWTTYVQIYPKFPTGQRSGRAIPRAWDYSYRPHYDPFIRVWEDISCCSRWTRWMGWSDDLTKLATKPFVLFLITIDQIFVKDMVKLWLTVQQVPPWAQGQYYSSFCFGHRV